MLWLGYRRWRWLARADSCSHRRDNRSRVPSYVRPVRTECRRKRTDQRAPANGDRASQTRRSATVIRALVGADRRVTRDAQPPCHEKGGLPRVRRHRHVVLRNLLPSESMQRRTVLRGSARLRISLGAGELGRGAAMIDIWSWLRNDEARWATPPPQPDWGTLCRRRYDGLGC